MGSCASSMKGDIKGGKQAVGATNSNNNNNFEPNNDAVDHFHRSHGLHQLFTQIELSLSASNLRDCDIASKSDPMAVVYLKQIDGRLDELGRTEVIMNNLSPSWIQKIAVAYHFETVQHLVFHIYDVDTSFHNLPVKQLKLQDQDFLGEATCNLSQIVTKQSHSLTINLQEKGGYRSARNMGTLTVHAEEIITSRAAFDIVFSCRNLDNKDLFSKSDPFLRISRISESGGTIPVCKTEVVDNDLNPTWRPLSLSMQQIGSKDNPLLIECFDFNSNGNHVLIGKMQKSFSALEKLNLERNGASFVSPSSILRGHEKVLMGQLFVDRVLQKEHYSFLDYISSGFELNFMVAVDFTASNGNPLHPNSLHYIDPSGLLNSYQRAIMEIGEVLQFYDSDRRFPAWGFGGMPKDGSVSHCFNLSETPVVAEVEGIEGIMAAYTRTLRDIVLAGPTLFGQVINRAAKVASHSLQYDNRKYFVLLIITDGVLTDLQETIDAVVRASDLPLSILIVGVGGADFTQMKILDADNGHRLECSTGRIATRDIVQFVPMRDLYSARVSVVQALLEELPGQFLTYMRARDVTPLPLHAAQR